MNLFNSEFVILQEIEQTDFIELSHNDPRLHSFTFIIFLPAHYFAAYILHNAWTATKLRQPLDLLLIHLRQASSLQFYFLPCHQFSSFNIFALPHIPIGSSSDFLLDYQVPAPDFYLHVLYFIRLINVIISQARAHYYTIVFQYMNKYE